MHSCVSVVTDRCTFVSERFSNFHSFQNTGVYVAALIGASCARENMNEEITAPVSEAPLPMVYTVQEAAKVLTVSPPTIYRLLKRGLIRSSSALRHKLIPRSEIERF